MREYYRLTKPGIIYGNTITGFAGFALASRLNFDVMLCVETLLGLAAIIAASCVFNNYVDRGIDREMARTKQRALATGAISGLSALSFGTILLVIGCVILGVYTNPITLSIALFGMFAYLVLYGLGKRLTVHGTLIGSISGAVPPVVGYVAVTNRIDTAAYLLFVVLVLWQLPHFYAIAMFRAKDYAAAGIPVLPVVQGVRATKLQIMIYIAAFIAASSLLTLFHYTGLVYLAAVIFVGLVWFVTGLSNYNGAESVAWAKKMFKMSLVVLLVWSLCVSLTGPLSL